jgi:hypothetical protein
MQGYCSKHEFDWATKGPSAQVGEQYCCPKCLSELLSICKPINLEKAINAVKAVRQLQKASKDINMKSAEFIMIYNHVLNLPLYNEE